MKEKMTAEYGDFPITKLPPGKAYGAGDLGKWSSRRLAGRSGAGSPKTAALTLKCRSCGKASHVFGPVKSKVGSVRPCPHCRQRSAVTKRVKELKE